MRIALRVAEGASPSRIPDESRLTKAGKPPKLPHQARFPTRAPSPGPIPDEGRLTADEIARAKDALDAAVGAYNNAKQDVETFAVTFDARGGEPAPAAQTVNKGNKVAAPTAPAKAGRVFQGWTLDGEPYDFAAKVNKDIALAAKWQAVSETDQLIVSIDPIADQQYMGDPVTPAVTVRDADGNVVDPSKYDVAYKDNVAPGKGIVTVRASNNAHGSAAALFTVVEGRTKVAKPEAKSYTYNGKAQAGVAAAEGYTLSGTAKATDAGTYKATAKLKKGYMWSDGTTTDVALGWKISSAPISPKVTISDWAEGGTASAPSVTGNPGNGKVTYEYAKQGSTTWSASAPTKAKISSVRSLLWSKSHHPSFA